MKPFEYAAPKTINEAVGLLGDTWGRTEVLAGGTDLLTCIKDGLASPSRLVSLRNLAGLDDLKSDSKGLRIGAMVTLAELAAHSAAQKNFRALVTAATGIGSAQMMNMGTVGGDLCQRPRCWFFRNGNGLLAMKDGKSLVRDGDNRNHAVFNTTGNALFVSASSLGPALVALGAEINVVGPKGKTRKIAAAEFFTTPRNDNERETALKPNEIVTDVFVPNLGLKNATYEVRHRAGLDWPYVTATVAYKLNKGLITDARVVLGHVATTPHRAASAGRVLEGLKPDESAATRAGLSATDGAKPLSGNTYKLQLVKTAVKRAVLAAA
ncbi:MAG: molybdopterin dehydrogenase [Verrucomicrobia bacterium]|nr:molybdopterin dehydrogenase [Verrucomicrobiota bacterium]